MIYAYIAGVVKTLNKSYENGVTFRKESWKSCQFHGGFILTTYLIIQLSLFQGNEKWQISKDIISYKS